MNLRHTNTHSAPGFFSPMHWYHSEPVVAGGGLTLTQPVGAHPTDLHHHKRKWSPHQVIRRD
jgi:hypothetical protein